MASRIELRSNNAKFITFFAFLYSAIVLVNNLFAFLHDVLSISFLIIMRVGVASLIILNLVFPFAMYKSLIADTKYWRGLGKYNKRPFRMSTKNLNTNPSLYARQTTDGSSDHSADGRDSQNDDDHAPVSEIGPVSISVASRNMQSMMGSHTDILIEFFHLQVGSKLGRGSTAIVYKVSLRACERSGRASEASAKKSCPTTSFFVARQRLTYDRR
jgi:hypothetical protein